MKKKTIAVISLMIIFYPIYLITRALSWVLSKRIFHLLHNDIAELENMTICRKCGLVKSKNHS